VTKRASESGTKKAARGHVGEGIACGPHAAVTAVLPPVAQLERAAALFRALADPSRLALLLRLDDAGLCVGELQEATGAKLSTLSQQLRVLHVERLVSRRREGKHVRYTLADEHVRALARAAIDHVEEAPPRKKGPTR
jgi:DNA-binding transcriptional ArsR family regulator